MKIFMTGATGYLGNLLAMHLADQGHVVHALIRNTSRSSSLNHKNIRTFVGCLTHPHDVANAMDGCEQVYHVAGQVKPWMKDPKAFYETNVWGTANICEQGIRAGVKKLVFTSTTGVLGPSKNGPLNEDSTRMTDLSLHYDRSKKMAEDILVAYLLQGLNSVIVSPAKIFGPGHASHSLTANNVIGSFLRKKITFVPSPSTFQICFAYVNDVVKGHVLAMENGISGQRYILGGHNISYHDFFDRIRRLANTRARIVGVSRQITKLAGRLQELNHKLTGADIVFTAASANYAFANYIFSSEKAVKQLGYTITPLDEALIQTIQFLNGTT